MAEAEQVLLWGIGSGDDTRRDTSFKAFIYAHSPHPGASDGHDTRQDHPSEA